MRIKLTHLLGTIIVETSGNDPDEMVKPTLSSDSAASDLLEEIFLAALGESAGHYGNVIDPANVSNLDLQAAVYKLEEFEVVELEPQIFPSPLPEDATP